MNELRRLAAHWRAATSLGLALRLPRAFIISALLFPGFLGLPATALAASLGAQVNFPQGLTPGQTATVSVTFAPPSDTRLATAQTAVILEGGATGSSRQVTLTANGGAFTGQLVPDSAGRYRVSLRLASGGRQYASVQTLQVPVSPTYLHFDFDAPLSRSSIPVLQIAAWAIGAALLGFVALRGAGAF